MQEKQSRVRVFSVGERGKWEQDIWGSGTVFGAAGGG